MKNKKKSPYRILRLRSGDDIIAKIVGKKGDKFILERPMQMKAATILDDTTNIPTDWVATFLTPQDEISDLYEHEKRKEDRLRAEMERLENAEPSDKLEVLANIMQMMKESKEEKEEMKPQANMKDMIEPGSVIVNLAIPPAIFFEMIANGVLEDFDLEQMMGGNFPEGIDESTISDLDTSDEEDREDFGSRWTDWSPNVKDYLDDE